MRFLILFLLCIFNLQILVAQEDNTQFRRHFLEIAPATLNFKRGMNLHHHLDYRFLITPRFYLNATTNDALFKRLDYSGRSSLSGIRPLFNESSLVVGYQHAFQQLTETNRKVNLIGLDIGYHYIQYSANPNNWEYDIIDTTDIGFRRIGGFRVHSLKTGLTYQHIVYSEDKNKPAILFRHFLSTSVLYGIDFQQTTYVSISPYSSVKAESLVGNTWKNRNGFKIEYTFQHFLSKRIGLLYGFHFTWAPWVDYNPNYNYFVPRGGQMNTPGSLSFRVGLTFQ